MRIVRTIAIAAVLAANLAFLPGCADKAGSRGEITLKWAVWDYDQTVYYEKLIEAYHKKNPKVKIEYVDLGGPDFIKRLDVQLSRGLDLDVMCVNLKDTKDYISLVKKNMLEPLNGFINHAGIDMGMYLGLTDQLTINGDVYALPFRGDYWYIFYNKDVFDAAGVAYPSNNMTLDDYDALARRIVNTVGNAAGDSLELRTIDEVGIGNTDSERAHQFSGRNSKNGFHNNGNWRDASGDNGGHHQYTLKTDGRTDLALGVRYWGNDQGNRAFDILIDDKRLVSENIGGKWNEALFYTVEYPIPADMVAGKKSVTVKFQSSGNNTAGGVYGLRMLKDGSKTIKEVKTLSGSGEDKVYGAYYQTWRSATQLFGILDGKNTVADGTYEFLAPYYKRILKQEDDGIVQSYTSIKNTGTNYTVVFENNRAAMLNMGTWFFPNLFDRAKRGVSPSLNWGLAKYPHPDGVPEGTTLGNNFTALSINRNSKHKDAAFDFLKFISGPEGALVLANLGIIPIALDDNVLNVITSNPGFPQDENSREALKITKVYQELPVHEKMAEIEPVLNEGHDKIMMRNVTVEQGIAWMNERVRWVLTDYAEVKDMINTLPARKEYTIPLETMVSAYKTIVSGGQSSSGMGQEKAEMVNGKLVINAPGGDCSMMTPESYTLPLKIDVTMKTDRENIRLHYNRAQVILNWESNRAELRIHDTLTGRAFGYPGKGLVPPDEFVDISWVLHNDFMALMVNGDLRLFAGNFPYNDILKESPQTISEHVKIGSAFGSTVTIKSLKIKEL